MPTTTLHNPVITSAVLSPDLLVIAPVAGVAVAVVPAGAVKAGCVVAVGPPLPMTIFPISP